MILGLPCVGLGLCHIGSAWVLNGYGQPLRDETGYHVDPNGDETIKWYRIEYLKKLAYELLEDRKKKLDADGIKIKNKQLSLFGD